MKLIVGLGNPGETYADTRHNIGWMALDAISKKYNIHYPGWDKGRLCETTWIYCYGEPILLLKPLTFMNSSGEAVFDCSNYESITPSDIIVIHDDMDLDANRLKIKVGGGHGGHNGLKSIDFHLNSKEYKRVRLGIGSAPDKTKILEHVLGKFTDEELGWVNTLTEYVSDNLSTILSNNFNDVVSRYK